MRALFLGLLSTWPAPLTSVQDGSPPPPSLEEKLPPPLTEYRGRRIAPVMSYEGADWLTRKTRHEEEHCERLLEALEVKAGMVVCDFGCGNGFYTVPLARLVGERGKVLAVDIQPQMLELLSISLAAAGVEDRVEAILGTVADPRLPEGKVDLALLVDVYHELTYPEHVLHALRRSLAPGGRIVLVEFRLEDPEVPIKELHRMSKAQILKEIPPNGFRLTREFDELPWQHVMFFGADPEWVAEPPGASDQDPGRDEPDRAMREGAVAAETPATEPGSIGAFDTVESAAG